jgi:hypothetical protein
MLQVFALTRFPDANRVHFARKRYRAHPLQVETLVVMPGFMPGIPIGMRGALPGGMAGTSPAMTI